MKKNIYYATIKPRKCVSVNLSGLCSMNLYQSPKNFTLMIWLCRATAIGHVSQGNSKRISD